MSYRWFDGFLSCVLPGNYRVIMEFYPITSNLGQCTVKYTKGIKIPLYIVYLPSTLPYGNFLNSITSLELACLTVGLMGFLVVFYQVITG